MAHVLRTGLNLIFSLLRFNPSKASLSTIFHPTDGISTGLIQFSAAHSIRVVQWGLHLIQGGLVASSKSLHLRLVPSFLRGFWETMINANPYATTTSISQKILFVGGL